MSEFALFASDEQEVKDLPATPHYVAPEVLAGAALVRTGRTWRASDMYACDGAVLCCAVLTCAVLCCAVPCRGAGGVWA